MNLAVINLPERTDRKAHMETQLARRQITNAKWFAGMPGGRIGCRIAHQSVLNWVVKTGEETIILEDDVLIQPGFDSHKCEGSILFLGGQWTEPPPKFPGRFLVTPGRIHRSHAYQVTPEIAEKILRVPMPEDVYYDHFMSIPFSLVDVIWPFAVIMARMGSDVS
jgi:hypothetical protein